MSILHRTALAAVAFTVALAANAVETVDLTPHIHGAIRSRFEWDTETGDHRFQVRNARLTLDGKVATWADYFVQTDLCDMGKMKILDAWARASLGSGVKFQAGQFRMPFGIDPFRAPNNYIFANRSFLGKQMCNYRAVGAKLSWQASKAVLLEGGAFNPKAIGDHDVWQNSLAYAARAVLTPGNWKFSGGIMSIRPNGVRANLWDATAGWSNGRLTLEGEFMHKHYVRDRHKGSNSYVLFTDYRMPVKIGPFNRLSFQGRFDGITDHSNATPNDLGDLITNDPARRRVTLGSTITYFHSSIVYVDLRVNYEKYMYNHDRPHDVGAGDKVVAEVVVRF